MAISYSLELVTPWAPVRVARRLVDVARPMRLFVVPATAPATVPATADTLLADGALTVHGTWIRVTPLKPTPWGDPRIGGRVFTPTVSVAFRLGKTTDVSGQQDDMIRLSDALLARVPGDAVLHLDQEDVWMVRRDGELILGERSDSWPPDRLATVSGSYRRRTYEFVHED
ncbi:SitI3 family protein [Kitasatospora sp. NPDC006786]|uniref:SitI3 family protein n=1 Tax=unclassified Kitasatospora TaxID=2633591 RepID=UPI0033CA06D6